jgi:PIN domain nuclease of toxin-antitoxin system
VRLLLDTQVLLWWLADHPSLSAVARAAIAAEPDVYVSAASAWEIASKRALGKLEAPADLAAAVEESDFRRLAVGSSTPRSPARCLATTTIPSTACWSPRPSTRASPS